jgi:hypothetical protein
VGYPFQSGPQNPAQIRNLLIFKQAPEILSPQAHLEKSLVKIVEAKGSGLNPDLFHFSQAGRNPQIR